MSLGSVPSGVDDDREKLAHLDFGYPCARRRNPHEAEFMLACRRCDWFQYVCRKHLVKHRIYIEGFLVLDKRHEIVCESCGWRGRDWDKCLEVTAL
jgi:hypothetical protein